MAKLDAWFAKICAEKDTPNSEQAVVLNAVRHRLLMEVELSAVASSSYMDKQLKRKREDPREEPLRGLTHGLSGTGKSRVIHWIICMFEEAMGWKHGREFVCVAFQNKVAHAIKDPLCIPLAR